MVARISKYFHQGKANEQKLYEGLITESIQLQGSEYFYLPRDMQIQDLIMGEDVISSFGLAIPIEMYLSNPMGFDGDKEMFSKFGLELRNSYKLVVAKNRWEQEVKSQFDSYGANGESNFPVVNYIRPREGDLIYDPMTKYLMEITFVDHDAVFYALGKNYQYTLTCEPFQFQNEIIETGLPEIDIFAQLSTDTVQLDHIVLESGSYILAEDLSGDILLESAPAAPVTFRPYGTDFTSDATTLQATTVNPFA